MGRPFKKELEAMEDTYEFVMQEEVNKLFPFFKYNCNIPLLIVGSGGSYAVAKMFELCYQSYGGFAKAITPYELKNETGILGNSKILIVTAGGNNPDTVGAYNYARLYEPFKICVICMSKKSKISQVVRQNDDAVLLEISIPFGKDGYLAVNSSVAMFTIGQKIMEQVENNLGCNIDFSEGDRQQFPNEMQMKAITNFIVLYGGWGAPAAYDLESKCSEAGLMSLQFVNYRNFAHGRHNWIDKNKDSTMIVALVTPQDKEICRKTLRKLPEYVSILQLETINTGSVAALELLVKVFYLVNYLGEMKGIDPGQPHVPDFGGKLYNIKYNLKTNDDFLKRITQNTKEACIYRKMKMSGIQKDWYEYYSKRYDAFVDRLYKGCYKGLVLDYDGTVCDADKGLSSKLIITKLNELLQNHVIVAFATGRGDSIIKPLRDNIHKEYWENVIIGYYNGSHILGLSQNPIFESNNSNRLYQFYDIIKCLLPLENQVVYKAYQVSIRESDTDKLIFYFEMLQEVKDNFGFDDIEIFMSGHAVDVILKDCGKQKVVEHLKKVCTGNILCIGDEGRLFQNDYEIMSQNDALSANQQNLLGKSGWNLAPLGVTNMKAAEFYFDKIKVKQGCFVLEEFG